MKLLCQRVIVLLEIKKNRVSDQFGFKRSVMISALGTRKSPTAIIVDKGEATGTELKHRSEYCITRPSFL